MVWVTPFNLYAEPKNCVSCHQQQVSQWQRSDHAKAMAVATADSVLGDFDNAKAEHFTQQALFYKKSGQFYIDFTEQEKTTTYQVKYTYGHYPLQQYLIPTDNGKLQVFPFAWDSQPKQLGGQKWYPIYSSEDIKSNDRLHWQQPLQNWNGMCADCHSDGLKRQFNPVKDQYQTTWDNINVGCQSCHGKMPSHSNKYSAKKPVALIDNQQQQQQVFNWLLSPGDKVAQLKSADGELASAGYKKQQGEFMNTCFACHSLRTPLSDGFTANQHFLQQFTPTLLTQPYYHADGQIKDEVYVYGSFLQSKMYQQGVTCLNCHDAHTMKVKTQTNGLCLQCHNAENYQKTQHTNHPLDSAASQCVNCHMPETTYMGVDARRDHSFKIPRPHLSEQYNTPNACSNCHQEKSSDWAAKKVKAWFGEPKSPSQSEQDYLNLLHSQQLPLERHLAIINDPSVAEIKRATAITLLPATTQMLTEHVVSPWVKSPLPLIRLATAQVGHLLASSDKTQSYQQLLTDELKAVRVAAANQLLAVNVEDQALLNKAVAELLESNDAISWRGEGLFNKAMTELALNQQQKAISSLQNSINVDPYFAGAYINLSDIYRQLQLTEKERAVYDKALKNVATSAELQYAYGMFLIRSGNKHQAVEHFKLAMTYNPENGQYAYLYYLALDSIGKTTQALTELKQTMQQYQGNPNLKNLGLSFSQKLNDRNSWDFFQQF